MFSARLTRSAGACLAALAGFAAPAGLAAAAVREVCDVSANVVSVEEVSTLGTGSRKLLSPLDPSRAVSSTFLWLVTLEVFDAIPFAPGTVCSGDVRDTIQKVVMDIVPEGIAPGTRVRLVREFYADLTPQGLAYEVIWSAPLRR